jgi:hypothetical protein
MRHLNPNWEFLSMTTGYVYNRPDLVTIGVFMRGVLLGELGFNNLIANGGLSKLAKDLCQGQRGYSLRTYEIGFQQGETHIVDRDTGWDELVKIYESQLLSGEDIRNVLNEFTYVIAFQSIPTGVPIDDMCLTLLETNLVSSETVPSLTLAKIFRQFGQTTVGDEIIKSQFPQQDPSHKHTDRHQIGSIVNISSRHTQKLPIWIQMAHASKTA